MKLLMKQPFALALLVTLLAAPHANAQEGLLWKVTSRYQPAVVPPYNSQPNPFAGGLVTAQVSVSEVLEDEAQAQRERQMIIDEAANLLKSSRAFEPYLDGMVVGGVVEGAQGRRVLIGNNWVGVGMALNVRLGISPQAQEALARIEPLDSEAAQAMRRMLEERRAKVPTARLTLLEIAEKSLVFEGANKRHILPMHFY